MSQKSLFPRFLIAGALPFCFLPALFAQFNIGQGKIAKIYENYCATCHGEKLDGGLGGSLVDDTWIHGSSDEAIARSIREGNLANGMPGWANVMSEEEIRAMVIFIREQRQIAESSTVSARTSSADGVFTTERAKFRLEAAAPPLDGVLWAIDFLPDGRALATERGGKLWLLEEGAWKGPVEGTPEVLARGQGGLLDVAVHPGYADNGWIYLSYSDRGSGGKSMTRFVRGRLEDLKWVEEEVVFEVPEALYLETHHHYGSRFAFRDGYVFFSIGERGHAPLAQDLPRPNGKIFRLHDDGRVPEDNPFVDTEDALPAVWSYGHRNPQGLAIDPRTGELWETEHGPRGGDELNRIRPGLNFGWPEITHGMNYDGTPITDQTAAPGMEQPVHHWTPSIAPCGINFYTGSLFPEWSNDLFATGLSAQEVQRLRIRDNQVVETEVILKNQGRVRDVATGPDGALWVLLVDQAAGSTSVLRLIPAQE